MHESFVIRLRKEDKLTIIYQTKTIQYFAVGKKKYFSSEQRIVFI